MIANGVIKGPAGRDNVKREDVAELDVPVVSAICAHGHRWSMAVDDLGRPCMRCGHKTRRATAKDDGRPVVGVVYVPPDSCPCGSAA